MDMPPDPLTLFRAWYDQARSAAIAKPNAMTLATVGADGKPASRIVLLSSYDERGFVFHTNYLSRKGEDLAHMPWASLLFWWDPLGYQVRIEGSVERTSLAESDAYFAGRPRGAQIGAWASTQSRPLLNRAALMDQVQAFMRRFEGEPVPRPPHWGGYRLLPRSFEFWQDCGDRLHDRISYQWLTNEWRIERLYP